MRARTRDMFKRGFKNSGMIPLTTFLRVYKVGDIVDIKANAAQQKGMPHKYYHGYVVDAIPESSRDLTEILLFQTNRNRV
jgi:ribosomal protein L21E